MITHDQKLAACKVAKNDQLLRLVHVFGHGLIYRKHLINYMSYFYSTDPIDVGKQIKALDDLQLVERIKVAHVTLIKLRKFALSYLTNKPRESLASIRVTNYMRRKTAFVNESLWQTLQTTFAGRKLTYDKVLTLVNDKSTMWLQKYPSGYHFLETLKQDSEDYLTLVGKREINRLKKIEQEQTAAQFRSRQDHVSETDGDWDFTSMYMSSIYVKAILRTASDKRIIVLSCFDLSGQGTKTQLINAIDKTLNYLFKLVQNVRVIIEVATESSERLSVLQFEFDDLYKNSLNKTWSISFNRKDLRFVDLKLTQTLFGKQPILLAGKKDP
ncbi:hypothetical protein OYT88_14440 [Sporolactobacillus sp. CQH2019]|uniref:hypothetical protein n=1 Tax=Sporolactobacillus sp. CQH2019 TaxID=3023512 RepID=UPI0023679943|nr:hypothetical protein [Sporolactobacillus sp. CQH2019]MDD9149750.1 hypothetical protein [Sporolactobacillus sp. CQH2019]